jgi:metal-responsive CopG/Arc/MetJ family transcriptional regulator
MQRTQIQLTETQYRRIQKIVAERGISMAAIIRQWIDEKLEETAGETTRAAKVRSALEVLGRYRDVSGADRVAENHDEYLLVGFESMADEP